MEEPGQDKNRRRHPVLFTVLVTLLLAAVVLGGAYLLGRALCADQRKILREPGELYYPVEPYTGPADAAAAPARSPAENVTRPAAALRRGLLASLSNETVGWGQGVEVNGENQPTGALQGQEKYGPLGAYYIFPDAGKTVYLTFDLGYENGNTAAILDALKEKGVRGTFFVTMDYVKSAPELVRRILNEGHILGNHSVTHPSMPSCSDEKAENEVMELHEYVRQNFGCTMSLFRFPRGEFSERTLALVHGLGYTSVFWSYAYVDWKTDAQPDAAASLAKLLKAAHPGAIYLLHTVSSTNAALMGDLIDGLRAAGYTVGELPH